MSPITMSLGAEPQPTSAPEEQVERLRRLQADDRHLQVVRETEALLVQAPGSRDLLMLAASSLRRLSRIPEALAMLDRMALLHPTFSRLHQERGLCHVAHREGPHAIEALQTAVGLNAALPMSWRALEGLYRLAGDDARAADAAGKVAALKALPADVVTATSQFFDGDLDMAEQTVRAWLLRYGDHPEALRVLDRIGQAREAGRYAGASASAPM